MRNLLFVMVAFLFCFSANAQKKKEAAKPKLVVGLVIDQMRWDFLERYSDRYVSGGFKRLMNEGFNCNSTYINYTPTYTAAGHACVYTGSVPALHGIMGNNWYNRVIGRTVYCTEDTTVATVGSSSNAGKMSPDNLWATTISDEIRLATNMRSKVIGIALKDRGSILPAGHSANGAYWFDNANGGFITSSYYMNELPTWVKAFNNRKLPDQYLAQNWNTLYPIDTYRQSSSDVKTYENVIPSEDNSFPHLTSQITKDRYNAFRYTPYANTFTFDMARAAVEGEQLGKDEFTDVLAISCSSTDYMGHEFGPNSIEMEDAYLRLDKDIEAFLTYLDKTIGKHNYTLFLTADHGVAHIPGYLKEQKIPGGVLDDKQVAQRLNEKIQEKFKIRNAVSMVINYQVYLNNAAIKDANKEEIIQYAIDEILKFPQIASAWMTSNYNGASIPAELKQMLINGYNQKLSGDVMFIYKPQYFDGYERGTTHGVWNPYDSHIPLLWYGAGIKKGSTWRKTYMTDIAATLAALLKVQEPNASIGNVIEEVLQ